MGLVGQVRRVGLVGRACPPQLASDFTCERRQDLPYLPYLPSLPYSCLPNAEWRLVSRIVA